jgi:hypothetical protein
MGAHDFTHMISHIVGPHRDPLYTGFSIQNTLSGIQFEKMKGRKKRTGARSSQNLRVEF